MAEDQEFFIGQKAFIEKDGAVLTLKNPKGRLDFPGGKIQRGEVDFIESMRREVREETGLEIEPGEVFYTWHFKLPPEHRDAGKIVYLVGFRCRYKSGEVVLSDEHAHFEWVTQETYQALDNGSAHFKALEKYFKTR